MDEKEIWEAFELERQANRKIGEDFQYLAEETIGNIAALKLLKEDQVEAVKNS